MWKFHNTLGIMQNTAYLIWKGQNRKSQKLELRPKIIRKSLRYSEAILISFVMLNNEKRHFVIRNAWNSRWLGFRHNDDLGIKLSLVGQCLMFVFEWAYRGSIGGVFLALTVYEFKAIFFVWSQKLMDCIPVMIHWVSKEESKRA